MSSKLESTMKNMVLSLGIISLVAGTALAGTYLATAPAIAAGQKAKQLAALKTVLPAFDNDPLAQAQEKEIILPDGQKTLVTVYPATSGGSPVGTAVRATSPKGFSGDVTLMTGFLPGGVVHQVAVLAQKETPGLGTKMTDPAWLKQFSGQNPGAAPLKVKKDGGTVDAITASTISSRAVCDAINRAAAALPPADSTTGGAP